MPTLADINLERLHPPGNRDDFVVIERPVFKEHWTQEIKDERGEVICESKFIGQKELAGIAERCNGRIADTGDWAPIVINHNDEERKADPELIGFAGPFRVDTFGTLKPKAAIYSKLWVFKDKQDKLRRYPRLSVEYWCSEENPTSGYFDPISLLGATTPELDLGVHYSRNKSNGETVLKYSRVIKFQAVQPGGANTSVPGLIGDDDDRESTDRKTEYSREPGGMFSPEAIQQLIVALEPVIAQKIDMAVAGMKAIQPGDGDGLGDELDSDLDGEFDELDLDGDADLDVGNGLDGLDDEDGDEEGLDEDLGGELGEDAAGELDDEDLGQDDADELEASPTEDDTEQADGDVADAETDDSEVPIPSEEDEDEETMGTAAPSKPEGETVKKYQKEMADLRVLYQKAETRARTAEEKLTALETRLNTMDAEKKRAVRYSKLTELRTSGYVIDIDQELTDSEPLNDEQFGRHCDKIVKHYQRAPVGHSLPIPASEKRDGVPRDEKRVQYSKTARDICLAESEKGRRLDYGTVLANVERNDGKYVPAS